MHWMRLLKTMKYHHDNDDDDAKRFKDYYADCDDVNLFERLVHKAFIATHWWMDTFIRNSVQKQNN